jgi:XRE family transcriptional regulator of biofilm formation
MLGRKIRRLREAAGLRQEDLARAAGVTQSYIVLLEKGLRKNPSLHVLLRIAKRLDADLAKLIE